MSTQPITLTQEQIFQALKEYIDRNYPEAAGKTTHVKIAQEVKPTLSVEFRVEEDKK